MGARVCLNCGKDISHRGTRAKTCNGSCRASLSRKRDRDVVLNGLADEGVANKRTSAAARAVQEEVRAVIKPVVREALTEDVMQSLGALIKLTSDAVQTLADHMHGDDPVLAQKAATTVMRYTVGHQALVSPEAAQQPQLVVSFDLPRPDPADVTYDDADADVIETFECDVCRETLPGTERVAGANRCQACHDARKRAVLEQYDLI